MRLIIEVNIKFENVKVEMSESFISKKKQVV